VDGLYAGIEAGGTKWICAVARPSGEILEKTQVMTLSPSETIPRVIAFLKERSSAHGKLQGIGIGSFGPLDLDSASATYGFLTTTPKPGWANINLAGAFRETFELPVGFDTDVNAAALGEARWGAAQGLTDFVYLTIGTGIGGGGMVNGKLIHGLVHPEMGHLRLPHDPQRDPFPGICPYHGDCLEGLASGPALEARWGVRGEMLPADHPAWELEAHYLALGLVNIICTLSPRRIILGGGVMQQAQLFPLIRQNVQRLLNSYIQSASLTNSIDEYIVPPALGNRSGVMGAIALALQAAGEG
jgi:fructokinase